MTPPSAPGAGTPTPTGTESGAGTYSGAGRRVLVLNGPNLGRLGRREPAVYGTATYDDLSCLCLQTGQNLGLDVDVRQTEYEGELLTWMHEACDTQTPVVLNAGALTHYSYALLDAVKMRTAPLVEVHISNIAAREGFRHASVITGAASGIIAGLGFEGYVLALHWIAAQPAAGGARPPLTVRPMTHTGGGAPAGAKGTAAGAAT
jgi:3-dehydroquinate dehydratase-2